LRVATFEVEKADREVARLEALAARVDQARTAFARAQEQATAALGRAEELGQRDRAATEAAEAAATATRTLRLRLARATRARAARTAKAQAEDLQRRFDRATALQATLDADCARRARITITGKALEQAETAQTAIDLARVRAEAQAVTIEALPDGPEAATIAGQPLPPGPHPILATTEIALPGFGHMRVDLGQDRGSDTATEVSKAARALDLALSSCGAETLALARQAWSEARTLDTTIAQGKALLAEVAPDGLDALRGALAKAQAEAADAPDEHEDADALTAALTEGEQTEAEARAAARAAHDLAIAAGETRAGAEADRRTAERRVAEAQEEAGDPAALSAQIATLRDRMPDLSAAKALAAQAVATLQAEAADLATTEARLARARGAADQARQAETAAREELVGLNATISALAEEGIEERLSNLAGERAEAEARAARYEAEVRALTRLRQALDEARTQARDAYFGPVLRELQPLLSILHPGAHLSIDDTRLLPATLTRDGQAEAVDILSGGTREQVAILTRLAFARLFAAAGRPVPVILDDALVHSDDDRIEAMFTALHRVARDQQIIVLTCRQRAFAALGGTRAEVTVEAQ
jgi:hypothetical protein